jgi:hypothetical protein
LPMPILSNSGTMSRTKRPPSPFALMLGNRRP